MAASIVAVRSGELGLGEAARVHNVPLTTLKRRLDGGNKIAVGHHKNDGRPPVLHAWIEKELAKHILDMGQAFFGFTRQDVRKLAFQIAEQKGIPHTLNTASKMAVREWLAGFLKRHPEISVREPQQTSIDRVNGFNQDSVGVFFDLLEKLFDEHHFNGTDVYNMDETGISTVQHTTTKILGKKGKKQVGCLSSAERGSNTTIVCCFSAAGQYVPPFILFKGMRMPRDLQDGAPPGSMVTCNESGWMTQETFCDWMKHFIACVKPSKEKKVLLILDGHTSHTKNLDAINIAREHGVILLSLPPHCSHKMQPLDVCFFRPLKLHLAKEQDSWMRNHFGRKMGKYQVVPLFSAAYMKAATMENAVNAFSKTGIFPCNRNAFGDGDFAASSRPPPRHLSSIQTAIPMLLLPVLKVAYRLRLPAKQTLLLYLSLPTKQALFLYLSLPVNQALLLYLSLPAKEALLLYLSHQAKQALLLYLSLQAKETTLSR